MKRSNRATKDLVAICTITTGLFLGSAAMPGCRPAPEVQPIKPPEVTVTEVQQRDVRLFSEFTGTAKAYEEVTLVARVKGFLDEIKFEPSTMVKKGDVLFVIEPSQYEAQLEEAEGVMAVDQAKKQLAAANLKRAEILVKSNTVTKEEYDRTVAEMKGAEAMILSDKATINLKKLDLSYTKVTSPITGLISRNLVDLGNLVSPTQNTELATIRRLAPIYVYFDMSDRYMQELLVDKTLPNPDDLQKNPESGPAVECGYEMSEGFPFKGRIDYIDNTVNPTTGTITVRARLDNKDFNLYPGMIVRIRVPDSGEKNKVLVQDQAIGTDLQGKYVLVLNKDNVVEQRQVKLGMTLDDGYRIVESGLKAGERYVCKGIQKARLGKPVVPIAYKPPVAREPKAGDAVPKTKDADPKVAESKSPSSSDASKTVRNDVQDEIQDEIQKDIQAALEREMAKTNKSDEKDVASDQLKKPDSQPMRDHEMTSTGSNGNGSLKHDSSSSSSSGSQSNGGPQLSPPTQSTSTGNRSSGMPSYGNAGNVRQDMSVGD